jgi:predicted RNase H-like HicB family nuclease
MSTFIQSTWTPAESMSDDADAMSHYSMVIEWDPRDDIYVVTVPELEGCRTHGRTYEEAVAQARDAIWSWLDASRAWGLPIPPPRTYSTTGDSPQ